MLFVDYHIIRTFSKVKCNITIMKEIISEPFLYYILLITSTYNKFIKSIIFIFFHNMPKNWLTANLNHWLWLKLAFFTYSCSETTNNTTFILFLQSFLSIFNILLYFSSIHTSPMLKCFFKSLL